jgi:ribosomal protein S18 acetylase RimI-like enzyme
MTTSCDLPVDEVAKIERIARLSWPSIEIVNQDGWLLRHADGITRRANSVWPNELQGREELETRIVKVEEFYHERNLPARFQLCSAAQPANLDAVLAQRGYRAVARTAAQTATVDEILRVEGNTNLVVELAPEPSTIWWECYAAAEEVSEESVTMRKQICGAIQVEVIYGMVLRDGKPIAVGSATYEDGWVGFFNIATVRAQRRLGAARTLMAALGKWGEMQGASLAYIQVMANNEPALALYKQFGFETGYYYHYREEVI